MGTRVVTPSISNTNGCVGLFPNEKHSNPHQQQQTPLGISRLLEDLRRLSEDEATCDVVFLCDDDISVPCHRLILQCRCSNFQATATGEIRCLIPGTTTFFTEAPKSSVPLGTIVPTHQVRWPGISGVSLREVISYVYTGRMRLVDENVFDILSIANGLGIEELASSAQDHILSTLKIDNAVSYLQNALRLQKSSLAAYLLEQCSTFINENATECLQTMAFLNASKDTIIHIISSDNLAMTEEDVWRSVLRWALHNADVSATNPHSWTTEERIRVCSFLSPVISYVRILLIDSQVFAEEVEPTGAVPMEISLERYRIAALPEKFRQNSSDPKLKARSHHRLFDGSKILSGERSSLQKILNRVFGDEKQSWKLLFRASTHGFSASAFHKMCDGFPNTMTIVQSTNGYVCAAFTDIPWSGCDSSRGNYVSSDKSFLVALTDGNHLPSQRPARFDVKRRNFAVIHHSKHGPVFGGGADLSIADNCNLNTSSYSNLPHSYEGEGASNHIMMGDYHFTVADYEVFTLA